MSSRDARFTTIDTPLGGVVIAATGDAITGLYFVDQRHRQWRGLRVGHGLDPKPP